MKHEALLTEQSTYVHGMQARSLLAPAYAMVVVMWLKIIICFVGLDFFVVFFL